MAERDHVVRNAVAGCCLLALDAVLFFSSELWPNAPEWLGAVALLTLTITAALVAYFCVLRSPRRP